MVVANERFTSLQDGLVAWRLLRQCRVHFQQHESVAAGACGRAKKVLCNTKLTLCIVVASLRYLISSLLFSIIAKCGFGATISPAIIGRLCYCSTAQVRNLIPPIVLVGLPSFVTTTNKGFLAFYYRHFISSRITFKTAQFIFKTDILQQGTQGISSAGSKRVRKAQGNFHLSQKG